ncbi:amino acid adenylation domain-containing protein [Catenulispora sp. GAS73]|uniref:non-ribosomal peptide synthetase n=1 Tax=Catenulispora sp. GAS73 TaxID=3156269 RepID=UPI0035120928
MEHPPGAVTGAEDVSALLGELAEHGVIVRARRGRMVADAPRQTPVALLDRLAASEQTVLDAIADNPGQPGPVLAAGPESAEPFALTDLQSAYHVGESTYPQLSTPAYIAHGFEVPDLDAEKWTRALRTVLERHEMLRVRLDDAGRQEVTRLAEDWQPTVVDWRHLDLDAAQARSAFQGQKEGAANLLPRLEDGPQLGCAVYMARDTAFVLLTMRLFVLDARSIGLLCRDLAAAYEGADFAAPAGPAGLARRYVAAVERHRSSQAYRNAIAYWTRREAEMPPPPTVPAPAVPARARFARTRHRLPAPLWDRLRTRATDAGLSANTVLCASYAEVLRRWSGQPSFTITVLVATRGMVVPASQDLENVLDGAVGNFGSTLLLDCHGDADGFTERAAALQRRLMESLSHVWVSGVEVARRARRRAGSPAMVGSPFVFASGLDASATPLPPHLRLDGWDLVFKSMHTPQVLLDHQVSEEDGELICNFDYVAEAFPEGLVEELAAAHADLLRRLADDPRQWTTPQAPPLPEALVAARRAANRTDRAFPGGSVLDGLRVGARDAADSLAFLGEAGPITYREAGGIVARTRVLLASAGALRGELVGVLARKSPAQYLAALGVIDHGATYVPLGVDWPPARLDALLKRHGIGHLLADEEGVRLAAQLESSVTVIAVDSVETEVRDDLDVHAVTAPDDLAYVIFTSGSTGTPKGVAIPHSGLHNTIQDMVERFDVGPADRVLSLSELHFDLSAFDLFGALHAGAAVVVPPCGPRPDPELWARWVRDSGATIWNTVPALLEMLLDHLAERAAETLSGLRLILLSGDWIPLGLPERIRRACPKAKLIALGGATEASIWSNYHVVVEHVDPAWKSIPYGLPLANQRYHVLDAQLDDVPTWVPGDLFIAGDGLARCYYGQPELTAARFPTHPRTGERLYRTGDHGRYWPDGTLEFLGRSDNQVKVRGYRVDLLEVEQQSGLLPGVQGAACVVTGTGADSRLVAFIQPADASGGSLDPGMLRSRLAAVLPGYAVPSVFHMVEVLPLTANGKRDTRALLALAAEAGSESPKDAPTGGRPPRNERERSLFRLWQQVCTAPVRSIDDDYFAIGGSSVSAVRLLRLIGDEFGVRLPLSTLFEARTIAEQCLLLDRRAQRTLVPIRQGEGPIVVLVHPVGGHLLGYRPLIEALPASFAVYGMQSPPAEELPGTLGELADEYTAALDALGTPLHLLGWSLGGVLAAETATRLERAPLSVTVVDSYVAAPDDLGRTGTEPDERTAAASFFADHLRQRTDLESAAVDIDLPAAHRDPFGHLAERLTGESSAELRELYGQFRALYRMLLRHRPQPLPDRCPVTYVRAEREDAHAFPGLTPLSAHPAGLVPSGTRVVTMPGTHYSIVRENAAHTLADLLEAKARSTSARPSEPTIHNIDKKARDR